MANALPTVVFFAGAFADPSCFDTLAGLFNDEGYPTVYARAPSLNPRDPEKVTAAEDSEHTRNKVLFPLLDEGKDVIVFTHSYGGVVGGGAAGGLSKSSRSAAGKKGGVIGLLYLAGNIIHEGKTLLEAVGGAYPPFIKQDTARKGVAVISPAMETLYNDGDPSIQSDMEKGMIPHSLHALETPAAPPAWAESAFDGRRAYLKTMADNCLPAELTQTPWLEACGVEWEVVEMAGSSHCPFITRPKEALSHCIPIFKKWVE